MPYSAFRIIDKKDNVWKGEVSFSSDLTQTCNEAIMCAQVNSVTINFDFNGVSLFVNSLSKVEDLLNEYTNELSQNYNKAINSPDIQKSLTNMHKDRIIAKRKGEKLLQNFENALSSESTLVKWFSEFSLVTDQVKLDYNHKEFAQKMKDKGFNYEIPKNKEGFTEKELLAISVLGNSYKALNDGKSIHHLAHHFGKQYEEIERKEKKQKVSTKLNTVRDKFSDSSLNDKIKNSL